MRVHGLRVHVERDPAVRVPQEFLYRLDVFPIRLQQSAEGMTEGVPADVLGDAGLTCHRPDVFTAS